MSSVDSLLNEAAFINGKWIYSTKTFDVFNPFDGKLIAKVPNLGEVECEEAIDAAYEAFQKWRLTTAKERSSLLRRWCELIRENTDELANILTTEMGKPIGEAKGEVLFGANFLEWFSEEAKRNYGDTIPSSANTKEIVTIRVPVGVAAMITPWNFPNAMIARKAAAALACGCTCVIKPAEDTPLSALAMAALAQKAGIPAGVINVVTTSRENASLIGRILSRSEKVSAMSFTGSTKVGKILYEQCASTVKKVSLELGGNAPFIVFDSADIDLAVNGCMASKFRNTGQTCVTSNRIFVQDGIYNDFVLRLKKQIDETLVLGNGLHKGVNQGPLVNANQLQRVSQIVDSSVNDGAKLVSGGCQNEAGNLFYSPTILTDVTTDMECFKSEIFGPVVAIKRFSSEKEVLDMANDCRVGLAGYFYSNDISQCWRVGKRLEVGMVGINEAMVSSPEAPFGGVKESGLGKEGSKYGMDEYSELKYLCFGINNN